jgi:hypothetical protein
VLLNLNGGHLAKYSILCHISVLSMSVAAQACYTATEEVGEIYKFHIHGSLGRPLSCGSVQPCI